MERGKRICKTLKSIRKKVAEKNGIPYEPENCTHEGPCAGTCPKCEAERQYIENALAEKERRGEPVVREDLMIEEEIGAFIEKCDGRNSKSEELSNGAFCPEPPQIDGEIEIPRIPVLQGFVCRPHNAYPEPVVNYLNQEYQNENYIFSPIGLISLLKMIDLGVRGDCYDNAIRDFIIKYGAGHFVWKNEEDVKLEHSTGMWYDRKKRLIKGEYVSSLQEMFGTIPNSVDFSKPEEAKAEINRWAAENTHGMIRNLDLGINPDSLLVLADLLYLKAKWTEPFDADETRLRTFRNADGSTSKVDMMYIRTDQFYYEITEDYQAVMMDYGEGNLSMTVLLPRRGKKISNIMKDDSWVDVMSDDDLDVELSLPRFELNASIDMKKVLKNALQTDFFERADMLTKISDEPLTISSIKQECALSVTESGTEAAAVTHCEIEVGCLPPEVKQKVHKMVVDRPFAFAIHGGRENILFMGVVNHLEDVEAEELPGHEDIDIPEPVKIKKRLGSMTVAGTSHVKNIDTLAPFIDENTQLLLRHETDNRYDRNAVGVYLGDERVGFLPKEKNEIIANLLDAGIPMRAVVTKSEWRGNWFCIEADIVLVEE